MSSLISIFTPALSRAPSTTITIDEFISGVKYGEWETIITPVRTEKNGDRRKELKKNVPAVTPSGTFTPTRQEDNLVNHSGFICIDIDGYTDRDDLIADPYTYSLFSSISNGGLVILVRINKEKHKESFRWLQSYYFKQYGITIDPAPQNPASLRFVSFDPHTFINEKSKQSRIISKPPKRPSSLPIIYPVDTVSELVHQATTANINIAQEYSDYINLGFALASGFAEQGRQYFHALCQSSEKYNSAHCDRQYDLCIKRPDRGITVGTFYWMLKNAGIKLPSNKQYEQATTIAAMAKRSGRTAKGVVTQLTEINNIPSEDAQRITEEVFNREDIELKTIAGDPEKLIESMMEWLKTNHHMRANVITGKVEEYPDLSSKDSHGREMGRERMNTIYLRARAAFNTPNVNFDLIERMVYSDFTESYNPFKEYIAKNSHLNTTGNIDRLIESITSDTPNYGLFVRKWLLCIPATIDGHPVRLVLALLGVQMSGKCLAKGTGLIMNDLTIKNVEDILPGDKLLGTDSTPRNVLSICSGREIMYKIIQHNGDDYVVNESHILSLQHRRNKKIVNVNILDYLKWSDSKQWIHCGYKGIYNPNKDMELSIDPYLLGVWLGDGASWVKDNGVQIEQMDNEVVTYIKKFAKDNGYLVSKYEQKNGSKSASYNIVIAKGSGRGLKRNNNHLKHKFIALDLNCNKHIPLIYKQSSTKQRLELLAGLIDSDGSLDKIGSMEITQANKKLSNDILFLCRSLGFKCSINTRTINNKPYYRVYIGGQINRIPCKIPHKKYNEKNVTNPAITGIKSVEKLSVDDYYGFQLDGDKLFMLSDFTVTHNTEWFRRLLPKSLSRYYGESKMDAGKDDELLMCNKLILMDDEMGGKSKTDEKRFKELTSKSIFSLRAPYGRYNEDYKRIALLCGTSNDPEVINDPTGNTRVLPVNVISIDHEMYNSINKDELLMEIVRLYESGEDYNLSRPEMVDLAEISTNYEAIQFERELILKFFSPDFSTGFKEHMTATEIKDYIETKTRQRIMSMKRFGTELKLIFGESIAKKVAGKTMKLYTLVKNLIDQNDNSNNSSPEIIDQEPPPF